MCSLNVTSSVLKAGHLHVVWWATVHTCYHIIASACSPVFDGCMLAYVYVCSGEANQPKDRFNLHMNKYSEAVCFGYMIDPNIDAVY